MAWDELFKDDGTTDIRKWPTVTQICKALREKQLASTCDDYWPPHSAAKFKGTISAITDNDNGTFTVTWAGLTAIPGGGTDDGSYWNGIQRPNPPCSAGKYWVDVSCDGGSSGGTPWNDGSYHLVIENNLQYGTDWRQDIMPWDASRWSILDNTNSTTKCSGQISNLVTSGFVDALSDLVGCNVIILRSSDTWWHERWPEFPNDPENWRGQLDTLKVYTNGQGYLQELKNKVKDSPYDEPGFLNNSWSKNKWKNDDVLFYDTSNKLHRLTCTSSKSNTIFFGGLTEIPDAAYEAFHGLTTEYTGTAAGAFTVVDADNRGYPERESANAFWWYGGVFDPHHGHWPDGSTADGLPPPVTQTHAAGTDSWIELTSPPEGDLNCESDAAKIVRTALDTDLWVNGQNYCDGSARSDSSRSPNFFKTLRGWQVDAEAFALGGHFVKTGISSSSNPSGVPFYSRALMWYDAGINAGTSAVTSASDGSGGTVESYTVPSAYYNQTLYCTIEDSTHRYADDIAATADNAGKVIVGYNHSNWAGATVYYSAGWTRFYPLEFSYLYANNGNLLPSIETDPDTGDYIVHDPPEAHYDPDTGSPVCNTGTYEKSPISPGIRLFDDYGTYSQDTNGFEEGKYYRYVGDNWSDGNLGPVGSPPDPIVIYYDHTYEGTHNQTIQAALEGDRSGKFFSWTLDTRSFTDTSKHWWKDWFNGGTRYTQSFTPISGGTTSVTTDSLRGDNTKIEYCWWNPGRFVGFACPYETFILEVDKAETNPDTHESETVTYKFPVKTCTLSGTQWVVGFDAQTRKYGGGTVTITTSDTCRIKEPYKVNRWKGKRIVITYEDLTKQTVHGIYSDDQTVWIDAAFAQTPTKGTTYEIIEYEQGGVWKYTATAPSDDDKKKYAWQEFGSGYMVQVPDGTADRGSEIQKDQRNNEPNYSPKSYGRIRHNDYVLYSHYDELYRALNKLRETQILAYWNITPGPNQRVSGGPYGFDINTPSSFWPGYESEYSGAGTDGHGGGPSYNAVQSPYCYSNQKWFFKADGSWHWTFDGMEEGLLTRAWNQPHNTPCVGMTSAVRFLAFATKVGGFAADYDLDTFDANGDGVVENQWAVVSTGPSDRSTPRDGSQVGGPGVPDLPPSPPGPADGEVIFGEPQAIGQGGYTITALTSICNWAVPGGMKYLD